MKDYQDLRTLRDASGYIAECLRLGDTPEYERHDAAAWIVGLGALDAQEGWYRASEEFVNVYEFASDAELSKDNADYVWHELRAASDRLARATKPKP